jgi:hypothetical protein
MESYVHASDKTIRKIEDIIDIQKAKGNFNVRQVAFNLPSDADNTASTNLAKSLESGLSSESPKCTQKKLKKSRSKRSKSPLPDVISWPSDSDITVLRMKLCRAADIKQNVGKAIPGDGLHQPDSSSMVNLATLILQSQTASKHNMGVEEYLLPLTSWERKQSHEEAVSDDERDPMKDYPTVITDQVKAYKPMCSHEETDNYLSSRDSDYSKNTKKSKMARFLRLYFCPCCTCLYRLEKMQEEPFACFTKHNESINVF